MTGAMLVTGANGFVGGAVLARAARDGASPLRGSMRPPVRSLGSGVEPVLVGDLGPDTDWTAAVRGVEVVVHTAARTHVVREAAANPLAEFRTANVAGTLRLARQARAAGARRLVFLSSIKVNGEATAPGRPFTADDAPAPAEPYGMSKLEAEQGLRQLAAETGLEIVVVRPVLVYGPGVKANFRSMVRWLRRGVPLPLGAIHNRRSLVALDNLVDVILLCARHPAAAGETFLVSDGEDLSTTELLRRTAAAMGAAARLIPVPEPVLRWTARAVGQEHLARRLCGSLQADIGKTRRLLGWAPAISVDEGLRRATAGL